MVQTSASLWPDEIRAVVKSPLSILLEQAEALTQQTGGVLVGKVSKAASDEEKALLNFDIVVPELDDYRHRIMTVAHGKGMNYPTMVDAEAFRLSGRAALQAIMTNPFPGMMDNPVKPVNRADSDKELTELVAKVLRSPYVVSVAQSLISQVADARAGKEADMERVEPSADPDSAAEDGADEQES